MAATMYQSTNDRALVKKDLDKAIADRVEWPTDELVPRRKTTKAGLVVHPRGSSGG